jgi:L-malate glycosyltransferase
MGFWYTKSILRALRVSNLFVNRMIANSDAVRRNVHHHERFPLARIDVLANGHDPARFQAEPMPDFRARFNIGAHDPIVGMVANFNPWKRHIDLIRAFARIGDAHPTAHLVLVGGGDADPLRAEARQHGLDRRVHIVEGITNAIPVVKHFSVGVLCSDSEGASNAVMEYMGSGKPTVCTNVGGNPELIDDDVTGFLIAPRDVEALATRIDRLLANVDAAATMGQLARLTANRFTSRRMADAHMELYEGLAHTRCAAGVLPQIGDRPSLP